MVVPRGVARFGRGPNRVIRQFAGWLPGFGVIVHRGRRSGRVYRTPVAVFRRPDGYVVALPYGVGDWTKNVIAAGGCELQKRRDLVRLTNPRIVHDPERRAMPPVVRQALRLVGVTEILHLDRAVDRAADAAEAGHPG